MPPRRAGWVAAEPGCYQDQPVPSELQSPRWSPAPDSCSWLSWMMMILFIYFFPPFPMWTYSRGKKNPSSVPTDGGVTGEMASFCAWAVCSVLFSCSRRSALHLHNIWACLAMTHKYLDAPGWRGKYATHHSEEAAGKLITCRFDWGTIHFAARLRSSSWRPDLGKNGKWNVLLNRFSIIYCLGYEATCWTIDVFGSPEDSLIVPRWLWVQITGVKEESLEEKKKKKIWIE